MSTLYLPLKAIYFDQIKAGTKMDEYRLVTSYWKKRIEDRSYKAIILTSGYPPRGDENRRLVRQWRGFEKITLTHEHFGPSPVEVYAIRVN